MRETTPIDDLGIPYPIVGKLGVNPRENNRHHHWHPGADLKSSESLKALRSSRIQKTAIWDHDAYHVHFWGPEVPTTRHDRFNAAVLCLAGYVPEHGLSFHGDDYSVVSLSEKVRERLWSSGNLAVIGGNARSFLIDEVGRHGVALGDVDSLIDQFMTIDNMKKRHKIASKIIETVSKEATQPIRGGYQKAWNQGRLPRTIPKQTKSMAAPDRPELVVVRSIVRSQSSRRSVVDQLERSIEKAA